MLSSSSQKTLIAGLSKKQGQRVRLTGWVYNLRSSGKIGFLILRDGSGLAQCVLNSSFTPQESFALFKNLSLEDLVEVEGEVKPWKDSFEIQLQSVQRLSRAEPYPLGKKDHGIDFLLSWRHLWLRSQRPRAIMSIRHEITRAIHCFFHQHRFVEVSAPVFTPNACEGGSTLFAVDFFNNKEPVYLSQSGQFYMESASASLGRVYCFNPAFRAEKSSTRRHLLEFWMVEPEMAFYDLEQCMELAESLIVFIVSKVLENRRAELKTLNRDTGPLQKVRAPFPRLHYRDAVQILNEKKPGGFTEGRELGGEDETFLSREFENPIFIHRYPVGTKAFYMKTDPKDPSSSLSFDLLGVEGYGELIGGSQREDNLSVLKEKMRAGGVEEKGLNWYLDLRRYGTFPHSGFGLGLERVVCWICGLDHVREAIAFPRLYGRNFFEIKK